MVEDLRGHLAASMGKIGPYGFDDTLDGVAATVPNAWWRKAICDSQEA